MSYPLSLSLSIYIYIIHIYSLCDLSSPDRTVYFTDRTVKYAKCCKNRQTPFTVQSFRDLSPLEHRSNRPSTFYP